MSEPSTDSSQTTSSLERQEGDYFVDWRMRQATVKILTGIDARPPPSHLASQQAQSPAIRPRPRESGYSQLTVAPCLVNGSRRASGGAGEQDGCVIEQARHEKIILGCYVQAADIDETWRLWATIEAWWLAVELLIATRVTNARTEAANTSIKPIKPVAAYGPAPRPGPRTGGHEPAAPPRRAPGPTPPTRRAAIRKINRRHLDPGDCPGANRPRRSRDIQAG